MTEVARRAHQWLEQRTGFMFGTYRLLEGQDVTAVWVDFGARRLTTAGIRHQAIWITRSDDRQHRPFPGTGLDR